MLPGTPRTFIGSTTFSVPRLDRRAMPARPHRGRSPPSDGVESVTVDLASGTVTVTRRPAGRPRRHRRAVDAAGYTLRPLSPQQNLAESPGRAARRPPTLDPSRSRHPTRRAAR